MTTVRDILTRTYPAESARIIALGERSDLLDDEPWDTTGAMLASLFSFAHTEEGHAYWAELARREGWRDTR